MTSDCAGKSMTLQITLVFSSKFGGMLEVIILLQLHADQRVYMCVCVCVEWSATSPWSGRSQYHYWCGVVFAHLINTNNITLLVLLKLFS